MAPQQAAHARSFVLPLLTFTVICACVTWMVLYVFESPLLPMHGVVLAYFAVITFILHYWQEGAVVTNPKGFVHRFMTGLVIKMFLSLIVLVCIIFLMQREKAIPLAVAFALLYLAFLAFSTVRLSSILRKLPPS